ncbi:hypothetical protein BMR22_09340 [Escherichia marmotae]|nr:hypothetical protein BMR22_09340 [Escherichia marmotae]PGF86662.1 hypothetical protein BMR23_07190 [Escherichia marmotae]
MEQPASPPIPPGIELIFRLSYLQKRRISYSFPEYLIKSKGES